MSDIQVFELEDDFDPLEDMGLADEEDLEEHDYLAPIPDADRSVMPKVVALTCHEKMDKLIKGIPGQRQRILHVIDICEQPRTIVEVAEELDASFPQMASLYGADRLVQLLVEAEALACLDEDGGQQGADGLADGEPATATAEDDAAYLAVTPPEPAHYLSTDEGLAYVAAHAGMAQIEELLAAEPRYLPIYQRILRMTAAEGGCAKAELNKAVDGDELCQEPKRYTEYFTFRLEEAGAVRWDGAWAITDLGHAALESAIFEEE